MPFDVTARLAEGGPAVADFETYVAAAHALGYQNPDLTTHTAQLRDVYGTEDGLDLRALESDADALSQLASLADEALQAQAHGIVELAAAWNGQAAESAREFLRRHQDSASAVGAALHEAAAALSTLRDQLWHAVDAKVESLHAIDGRCGAQRGEWLAAAHTVLTGSGDRATASEIVDQRVRPFVEADIASDWVSAMRTSTAAVSTAYDTAIAAVKPDQFTAFGVPGALGPTPPSPHGEAPLVDPPSGASRVAAPAVDTAVAPTVPAAAANPSPALATSAPPAMPAPVAAAPEPPASAPGLGDLGGMPAMGAGLAGLGRQLTDGMAGLTGAGSDALSGGNEPGRADESNKGVDDDEDKDEDDDAGEDLGDEEAADGDHPLGDVAADPTDGASPVDTDRSKSTTDPLPPPPPPVPTPSPEPVSTDLTPRQEPPARTPCEIAADEVPQVGE